MATRKQQDEKEKVEATPEDVAAAEEQARQEDARREEEAKRQEEESDADRVMREAHDAGSQSPTSFDVQPGMAAPPAVSLGHVAGARAVFDTSGTAGAADHDMRRASAAFDELAEARDEVPPHLEKYLESDEGYKAIVEREGVRREDA